MLRYPPFVLIVDIIDDYPYLCSHFVYGTVNACVTIPGMITRGHVQTNSKPPMLQIDQKRYIARVVIKKRSCKRPLFAIIWLYGSYHKNT